MRIQHRSLIVMSLVGISVALPSIWGTGCGVTNNINNESKGSLKVLITDKPFPLDLIEEATITITRVEVRLVEADDNADLDEMDNGNDDQKDGGDLQAQVIADADGDDDESEWVVIRNGPPEEFNLLDLQDGRTDLLASATIEAGTYNQMRLIVTQGRIVIGDNGDQREFILNVPSGPQTGIKLHFVFEVMAGDETTLLLDVDLSRAFQAIPAGEAEDYASIRNFKFTPSVAMKLINILEAGSITGMVTDSAEQPLEDVTVTAFKGGEQVTTTQTVADGTYTLMGLPTGTYTVTFTLSGFNDVEVSDVEVTAGATTEDVNATLVEL